MLKLKYLFENFDLAKFCLAQYDCDQSSIDEMLSYFRISSNAIYPFSKGSNPETVYFLRLSPVEEKNLAQVQTEIHLIQWLIQQGYPAMKPIMNREGQYAAQIQTPWGRYNVSCFERVPGKPLEDVEGTPELAHDYGKLLGGFHCLMKRYPYSEERDDHQKLLTTIQSQLIRRGAPPIALKEWEAVSQELAAWKTAPDTYGVVHYDFEPDNVFYDKEGDSFGVIDFDDSIRCWYSLDVARALDGLDEVVGEKQLEAARKQFMQGYRSVCTFTEEQSAQLPLMRRLVSLQEYATLLHVMAEPVKDPPEWMEQLVRKLKNKLSVLGSAMQ